MIFPNSLAWKTDFTRSCNKKKVVFIYFKHSKDVTYFSDRTLASMRSRRFPSILGSMVNSSNRYCHSQVSWPNVPLVTKKIPLEREFSTVNWGGSKCFRTKRHVCGDSPLGDHEKVGLIDVSVSKVPIFRKTSILNFLEEESQWQTVKEGF